MAIRLGNNQWQPGDYFYAEDFNDTFKAIVPIGTILPWLKTYGEKTNGTTTSTSSNKLIDSSATFITVGIQQDMVVYNQTQDTFAHVVSVDSETEITLDADIFASGDTYSIYAVSKLPNTFAECNGQVLNNPNSPFNGMTLPDLNGVSDIPRFLRGSTKSGVIGGSETHNHQWLDAAGSAYAGYRLFAEYTSQGENYSYDVNGNKIHLIRDSDDSLEGDHYTKKATAIPPYYEVVWIMRVA